MRCFVLQTAHGEVISRRQSVERMTELQQSKYQDLQAGLPSELSMQLAEVALALGSAEDQVTSISYSLTVYWMLLNVECIIYNVKDTIALCLFF